MYLMTNFIYYIDAYVYIYIYYDDPSCNIGDIKYFFRDTSHYISIQKTSVAIISVRRYISVCMIEL